MVIMDFTEEEKALLRMSLRFYKGQLALHPIKHTMAENLIKRLEVISEKENKKKKTI